MPRVATTVWTISPELVLALDAQLGLPVDSYLNGSQTWLVEDGPITLEWRLHPVAGYRAPAGVSTYDLWETIVAQLSATADPHALRLGDRGAAAHRDVGRPRVLRGLRRRPRAPAARGRGDRAARARARSLRPRRPRSDRRRVGAANGAVSIVALLLAQLEARDRPNLAAPGRVAGLVVPGGQLLAVDRAERDVEPAVRARRAAAGARRVRRSRRPTSRADGRAARRRSSGSGTRSSTSARARNRGADRRAPR